MVWPPITLPRIAFIQASKLSSRAAEQSLIFSPVYVFYLTIKWAHYPHIITRAHPCLVVIINRTWWVDEPFPFPIHLLPVYNIVNFDSQGRRLTEQDGIAFLPPWSQGLVASCMRQIKLKFSEIGCLCWWVLTLLSFGHTAPAVSAMQEYCGQWYCATSRQISFSSNLVHNLFQRTSIETIWYVGKQDKEIGIRISL